MLLVQYWGRPLTCHARCPPIRTPNVPGLGAHVATARAAAPAPCEGRGRARRRAQRHRGPAGLPGAALPRRAAAWLPRRAARHRHQAHSEITVESMARPAARRLCCRPHVKAATPAARAGGGRTSTNHREHSLSSGPCGHAVHDCIDLERPHRLPLINIWAARHGWHRKLPSQRGGARAARARADGTRARGAQLTYRNQGGFNMIGSGRDKIESAADLERAAAAVSDLRLDGLVVAGGDDSNTNAAVLAEYFLAHGARADPSPCPQTLMLARGACLAPSPAPAAAAAALRLHGRPVPGRAASVRAQPGRPDTPGAESSACCAEPSR